MSDKERGRKMVEEIGGGKLFLFSKSFFDCWISRRILFRSCIFAGLKDMVSVVQFPYQRMTT
jgi:hypothetical protein